ncbi:hypothetical protein FC98_GL001797 [Lentilactobacillus kisonensis DSM 19906 = JCM 15041]|uniref:Uncharacterized protein n=2 Tax=Lentilactobacillus kisonensis TaxID=481722 RepID=A0A0R1NUE2_9LACO|nr:hypothetical protein FC98_GL001797 [Lentilactobacillus kisonensis DSM 19906 = JCM 15041]
MKRMADKNNSAIKSKQNQSTNDTKKHQQVLTMIALMTSKLLGENTYAKSSIYAERLARGGKEFLDRPIQQSMSLAAFKLSKEVQLGYLAAVNDLRSVSLDQVYYLSLWAMGSDNDQIINRGAGNSFSEYLAQSKDSRKFKRGYQTAVIQFIRAIAGENGVLAKLSAAFQALSFDDATQLANDWFNHLNSYMKGASPFRKITDGVKDPADQRIVQGLFDELNNGFLMVHPIGDDASPLLGNYVYTGDDFSDQHDLPAMMIQSLGDLSLSETVNLFVNGKFSEALDLLCSLGIYEFGYRGLSQDNADLVGMPATTSVDLETVIKATTANLPAILSDLNTPATFADLAASLSVIDLSNAGTARNAKKQNFQRNLSVVMDNDKKRLIDDRGQTALINYGPLETFHGLIDVTCLLPVLVRYTLIRNQLLAQIKSGDYAASRNVALPDFAGTLSLTDYAEQLARYQIDQLMAIVKRGKNDYDGLNQAGSISAFNHLMRVVPKMRTINPNYAGMSKQTKKLYYWLYQSSFASDIAPEDRVKL